VQLHHELLKKHVTDPNQSALVENYLLTLPAVQRRALSAVTVAPVKLPAAMPETPKSAVKRHVPRLFNTPSDTVTASPSTFKRPSHVSHVTAGSVNSPIRPRKSLALLAPTAVRLTGGPRMSLAGVKSSRMSLGGPSRRQSLIGLLTAPPADTPMTPVTSTYGVKAAEESPRDSELKQRTPFKQGRYFATNIPLNSLALISTAAISAAISATTSEHDVATDTAPHGRCQTRTRSSGGRSR
jgi:hypothetical protein